jgi:hypothetical protein
LKKANDADTAKRLELLLRMNRRPGYTHLTSSMADVKRAGRAAKELLETAGTA